MTLKEISDDRELRKWCVEKALYFCDCNTYEQRITNVAEDLFQYIKFGPDDECDCCDDPAPCGPLNTEPGMKILRDVSNVREALRRGEIFPS